MSASQDSWHERFARQWPKPREREKRPRRVPEALRRHPHNRPHLRDSRRTLPVAKGYDPVHADGGDKWGEISMRYRPRAAEAIEAAVGRP